MRAKQANRQIIAERARLAGNRGLSGNRTGLSVGRNLGARTSTIVTATGHVKKTRAMKMTGAQKNSIGQRSEWSRSPEFFTDPKWSQTVGTQMTRGSW